MTRFKDGLLQPIGGWTPATTAPANGVPRALLSWEALDGKKYLAVATNKGLEVAGAGTLTDVTPVRATPPAVSNPYSTSIGSSIITVAVASHGANVGDTLIASSASAGGLTLSGSYVIVTVLDSGTFTIDAGANATSTTSGVGGLVTFQFLMNIGEVNNQLLDGWGAGAWGEDTWGTARSALILTAFSRAWSLDHWGEELIAAPLDGPIYDWKPNLGLGTRAAIISSTAPTKNKCILVGMPERHLISFGAETGGVQDPMLIRWCDVENYNNWTASATNSAGSLRVVGGSEIRQALASAGEILVWTDATLWALRFQGVPYIYGLYQLGGECGTVAPHAGVVFNGIAYWMSAQGFFIYSGSIAPLPCTVWDDVFRNINALQINKVTAASNMGFNSVRWHYPSGGSVELDSYVEYDVQQRVWSKGKLPVTAWNDAEILPNPIGAHADGWVFTHESGTDANGAPLNAWAESGFFDIGDGQDIMFMDRLIPDFADQSGPVQVTLKAQLFPNGAERTKGPFEVLPTTKQIAPRIRGRQIALRIGSNSLGSFWRLGALRARSAPDGQK